MHGIRADFHSIARAENFFRLIYKLGGAFRAAYFNNLTDTSVQVAYTDSSSSDAQAVETSPVSGSWRTLTSTNPWIPASAISSRLFGNWHVADGNLELEITLNNVEIDGDVWLLDSVQTNRTANRLLLRSGMNYKILYYQKLQQYAMDVILVDGKVDLQDRFGRLEGEFETVAKWLDIFDSGGFKPGARWDYDFSYDQIYEVDSTTALPRVTVDSTLRFSGRMEVEVTASSIAAGSGSLSLTVTFTTTEERGRYLHTLYTDPIQVLTDTTWADSSLNRVESNQYEIVLESDTLWYDTPGGRAFFASTKVSPGVSIHAELFMFIVPPWTESIERDDYLASVKFSEIIRYVYSDALSSSHGGDTMLKFTPSVGFDVIYYDFMHYARGGATPQNIRNILESRLVGFTPGQ
ncbi:MAG: hypothetical protein FVQ81_03915 [Candidatus Glassbacteria bacterium]|nr:hypothetical protein [Candidatus Glassbacteria bacterium]